MFSMNSSPFLNHFSLSWAVLKIVLLFFKPKNETVSVQRSTLYFWEKRAVLMSTVCKILKVFLQVAAMSFGRAWSLKTKMRQWNIYDPLICFNSFEWSLTFYDKLPWYISRKKTTFLVVTTFSTTTCLPSSSILFGRCLETDLSIRLLANFKYPLPRLEGCSSSHSFGPDTFYKQNTAVHQNEF